MAIGWLANEIGTGAAYSSVSIGSFAGRSNQAEYCIAIGESAGLGGAGSAGQAQDAIAIGRGAGQTSQSTTSVALGRNAGQTNQGTECVAIGYQAGRSNQHDNSIVINSTGVNLNTGGSSRCYIKPVRDLLAAPTESSNIALYNSITGELTHTTNVTAKGSVISLSEVDFFPQNPSNYSIKIGSFRIETTNNFHVGGSLSKSSGSFCIDHPLPEMSNTHDLYHSFIEGPRADLIYRGKVNLVDGAAIVDIDEHSDMTNGTFESLNRNVQCFTTNETDWDAVKGTINGKILSITCQNSSSTAEVSWMVIGERNDKHMYDTNWTDSEGRVRPEVPKPIQ